MSAVRIVELDRVDQMRAAADLFVEIWGGTPPVPVELMRALAKAGGWVAGAYLRDAGGDRLVAASVAFFAAPGDHAMHSHITGVRPGLTGHDIGFELKRRQREWARARGIREISWTFDPLVRRNAWFNLGKLAATADDYLVDFYGPMDDALNAGEPTDRLLVRWHLDAPEVEAAIAGRPAEVANPGAGTRPTLDVPADIETLRRRDPERAHAWRLTLRESMLRLLGEGYRIAGFDKERGYVLEQEGAS